MMDGLHGFRQPHASSTSNRGRFAAVPRESCAACACSMDLTPAFYVPVFSVTVALSIWVATDGGLSLRSRYAQSVPIRPGRGAEILVDFSRCSRNRCLLRIPGQAYGCARNIALDETPVSAITSFQTRFESPLEELTGWDTQSVEIFDGIWGMGHRWVAVVLPIRCNPSIMDRHRFNGRAGSVDALDVRVRWSRILFHVTWRAVSVFSVNGTDRAVRNSDGKIRLCR